MTWEAPDGAEKALFCCAFGSGCLAYYIGHLTRKLQRQNVVALENIKLRNQLHASLSAVTESRDHIAELHKLVSATARERQVLDCVFDEGKLPSAVRMRRVELGELKLTDVLGQGCFGIVHRATWRGTQVACKTMHRSRLNESDVGVCLRAAEVGLNLRAHPNIVRLHGLAWSCDSARVVNVM